MPNVNRKTWALMPCFTYGATLPKPCQLGNHIWLDPDFKLTLVPSVKPWPSGLWIHTCQNNIYHLWNSCCSPSAILISFHPSLLPSYLPLWIFFCFFLPIFPIFTPMLVLLFASLMCCSFSDVTFLTVVRFCISFQNKHLFCCSLCKLCSYSFSGSFPSNLLVVWRNVSYCISRCLFRRAA